MAQGQKQQPMLLYIAAGLFVAILLYNRIALYLARQRMMRANGCKPCPHVFNKDPILGIDVMMDNIRNAKERKTLERNLGRLHKFNANTYHNRIVNHPIIVTIEPENVKTVLSLKFKDYSLGSRNQSFGPLLGHGIFNADGERWANSRHLLRPNFARDQVADLAMLERHFKLLLKVLPKDNSTVDLQDLFFRMTIDSATEFLFDHSTHSLRRVGQDESTNEDALFAWAFNHAQDDVIARFRVGLFQRWRKGRAEGEKAIRICHAYVDKWVDSAIQYREERDAAKKAGRDDKQERYVFIHELAKQTKDKLRLREELINILLAGRDTTASLLSNMFFMIAKRPEIWAKLREEVSVLDGRLPSYEELRNFKYVKWCLNESLRIHPVVPGNGRLAIRDTILPLGGGPDGKSPLFVPRGTQVTYSTYGMHQRPDYFGPDAEEFRPERWATLRPGWEYLPFNGGPRICLGQQYALTEASYVTVRLAQEFARIESRHEGEWVEGLTLTLSCGDGVRVGLTPA